MLYLQRYYAFRLVEKQTCSRDTYLYICKYNIYTCSSVSCFVVFMSSENSTARSLLRTNMSGASDARLSTFSRGVALVQGI